VPTKGNLVFGITPSASNILSLNSVTDNKSNTWTVSNFSNTDQTYIFWCTAPCNTGPDMKVTLNLGTNHQNSTVLFYDISNAATSGTIDAESATIGTNLNCTAQDPPGDTTSTNTCPEDVFHGLISFTPPSLGLTVFSCAYGTGPSRGFHNRTGTQLTRPTGAIWNYVWYTGITDASRMDNSDCQAHYYDTSLAAQNWDIDVDWEYYTVANTATTAYPHWIHIKGGSVTLPPPTSPFFHFKRYRVR
jgi:hypothetical protein